MSAGGNDVEAAVVVVLDAIKKVREAAADERAALHNRGEPLTDYGSGVLDGLDKAWLAGKRAARRPLDGRETTTIEEWWACEDAYQAGIEWALAARAADEAETAEAGRETGEGVGTGAGEGATGQDTGTAWVTRSTDCPEAPAQAHPLAPARRANACDACRDCYHPAFGPDGDGDPWCRDCGCHQSQHRSNAPARRAEDVLAEVRALADEWGRRGEYGDISLTQHSRELRALLDADGGGSDG